MGNLQFMNRRCGSKFLRIRRHLIRGLAAFLQNYFFLAAQPPILDTNSTSRLESF